MRERRRERVLGFEHTREGNIVHPNNDAITQTALLVPLHTTRDELAHLHVLAIDDEPLIGGLIVRLLPSCFVTVEQHAARALARLDAGESFDRIVCDVMMPGMGAREFSRELRLRHPRSFAILALMTGGVTSKEDADFLAGSTRPLLHKPFCPQELIDILKRLPCE